MYCSNCGNLIKESDKFCGKCGQKVNDSSMNRGITEEVSKKGKALIDNQELRERDEEEYDYLPEELKKAVKSAGDSVFAIGILSLIITPIIYILSLTEEEDFASLIIIILVTSIVYAIFIHFGNKIRKDDLEDLNITLKNVSNTIIYSIVVFIFFILSGGWLGIFAIIMLIQLFKAKKLLKAYI